MTRSVAAALAALVLASTGAAAQAQGRFTVSADGQEVTDTTTRLVWKRCAEGQRFEADACTGKATRYSYAGARKAAGGGWRVPTREELTALLDRNAKKKPRIDAAAFPKTPSTGFWAAKPGSDDNLNAWVVNFSNGQVRANLGQAKFPLRLVKSAG
jgi:hypothetical protein